MATTEICSRCKSDVADNLVKTRGESFCSDCFVEFISIKFRRQMERYRVNTLQSMLPKLLVAISFGKSSIFLVDQLERLLEWQRQKHGGRVGFEIECICIGEQPPKWLFGSPISYISRPNLKCEKLSRTAKQDLEAQVLQRKLRGLLRARGAAAMLFGYSLTRLSELIISETVKGRGANIPALLHPSERFVYPLREIYAQEVEEYIRIRGLQDCVVPEQPIPPATKRQSIDELVRLYLTQVNCQLPSVVSAIAKTGNRLAQRPEPCFLCGTSGNKELCAGCRGNLRDLELDHDLDDLVTMCSLTG